MTRGKSESPLAHRINHYSPQRNSPLRFNSPSRLAQQDLEQTLSELNIYDDERQKLYALKRKLAQDELDAQEVAKATAHQTEIDGASAKHELVRRHALAVLEAHVREEAERRRREEEEGRRRQEEEVRRMAEEQRRLKEEHERKIREETEAREVAQRAEAEKARQDAERSKKAAEEAERRQREQQQQQQRQQQERARADADAEAARKRELESKPAPPPVQPIITSAPANATSSEVEAQHRNYLALHKSLKTFRRDFWEGLKADKPRKAAAGEMRRQIKTAVGQIAIDGKKSNNIAVSDFR